MFSKNLSATLGSTSPSDSMPASGWAMFKELFH
jgi:hypothetical protein